jgi:hypothetical protein
LGETVAFSLAEPGLDEHRRTAGLDLDLHDVLGRLLSSLRQQQVSAIPA